MQDGVDRIAFENEQQVMPLEGPMGQWATNLFGPHTLTWEHEPVSCATP